METTISLDHPDYPDSPDSPDVSTESKWTDEESRERLEQLSYDTFYILLPSIIFVVFLLAIGLSGNLVVFLVYYRQFPPSATRVFVLAMAACNITINIFCMPRQIILMRYSYCSQGVTYCRLVGPIAVFPILLSYWLLVCVAFDRRDRICHPLSRHLNPWQATCILIIPFTLTALVLLPFLLLQEEGPFDIGIPGLQGIRCTYPTDYMGVNFKKAYGILLVISYAIILEALVICYCDVMLTLLKNRDKRISDEANQRDAQPVYQLLSSTELASSHTHKDVDIKRFSGSSTEVKTSKETIQCDADTKVKAGDVKEPKTEECLVCCPYLGDPKTNNKPRHWQNRVRPETNETSVNREDYKESLALPVVTNKNSISEQVQDQETNERPEAIAQKVSEHTERRPSCLKHIEENGRKPKLETETLDTPSLRHIHIRKPRTTLMMFTLTVSTLICWTPYFIVELSEMSYVGQNLSSLTINIRFLARVFPSVNSVVTPFIYSFFSRRFYLESIRFFKKLKNSCLRALRPQGNLKTK
ncbi:octopamine receptor-like isoform X2 [Pomacea canaliculata]|nr:octopamine receptor-like isoform X2 [Pomacea canaliculata]